MGGGGYFHMTKAPDIQFFARALRPRPQGARENRMSADETIRHYARERVMTFLVCIRLA